MHEANICVCMCVYVCMYVCTYVCVSLSAVVLNSRDHYENVWLPKILLSSSNKLTPKPD